MTLKELEAELRENDTLLGNERRLDRIIELMMARMEIYKSMIYVLKRDSFIDERKVA